MLEYMSEFLIFLRLSNIPLCVQTTFCLFSQLWCFHLLVIVNPALIRSHNQDLYTPAMSMGVQVSVHVSAFK